MKYYYLFYVQKQTLCGRENRRRGEGIMNEKKCLYTYR